MPTDLTIVHPEDFIRATQTGALDLDASRELLRGIVSRLKAAGVHHVLIDLRQTTPGEHLSKSELISSNSVDMGRGATPSGGAAKMQPPARRYSRPLAVFFRGRIKQRVRRP